MTFLLLIFMFLYARVRWNNHLLCLDQNQELERIHISREEDRVAWEQGQEEMLQGFEQEYLTWAEQKEKYQETCVAQGQELTLTQARLNECKHIVEMQKKTIDGLQARNDSLLDTLTHLRVVRREERKILIQHENDCLPRVNDLRV